MNHVAVPLPQVPWPGGSKQTLISDLVPKGNKCLFSAEYEVNPIRLKSTINYSNMWSKDICPSPENREAQANKNSVECAGAAGANTLSG